MYDGGFPVLGWLGLLLAVLVAVLAVLGGVWYRTRNR